MRSVVNRIETHAGMSLVELEALRDDGFSVIRTPHLGNTPINNMILASRGIIYHCFDRNQTVIDENYRPEYRIQDEIPNRLASDEAVLVGYSKPINGGLSPAHEHYRSLSACLGDSFRLESEYLTAHAELTGQFLERFTAVPVYDRMAIEGVVRKTGMWFDPSDTLKALSEYAKVIRDNSTADLPGIFPLFTLPHLIALITAIEAKVTGRNVVYELSGPDMINYVRKESFQHAFQGIMRRLVETGFLADPVRLVVIPSDAFGLAVLKKDAAQADELLEISLELLGVRKDVRKAMEDIDPRDKVGKKALKHSFAPIDRPLKAALRERLGVLPKSFVRGGTFFTQYDLLEAGGELYIPPAYLNLSYETVSALTELTHDLSNA